MSIHGTWTSPNTTNNLVLRLRWIILQFPERTFKKAGVDERSQHFFTSPPSVLRIENLVTIPIPILAHHLILDIINDLRERQTVVVVPFTKEYEQLFLDLG